MGWYQSRFPKGNHGQEFEGRRGTKGMEKEGRGKRERGESAKIRMNDKSQ